MAIKFACPSCRRALQARDEFAGKRAECPFCGAMSLVPQGAPEPIQAELVTPPPVATTEIRQFFDAPTSTPKDERPKSAVSLRQMFEALSEDSQPTYKLVHCPACGAAIPPNATLCNHCSWPVPPEPEAPGQPPVVDAQIVERVPVPSPPRRSMQFTPVSLILIMILTAVAVVAYLFLSLIDNLPPH